MKQGLYTITRNRAIAAGTWEMRLAGDTSALEHAGQFVDVEVPGFYLRRPFSVCDWDDDGLNLIYKVVGEGTARLRTLSAGSQLDLLTGLGNGYDLEPAGRRPLLIGGGAGIPPLYRLARDLIGQGRDVTIILGFNRADELFLTDQFSWLGARVLVSTVDGSAGTRGLVTDVLSSAGESSYFYSCGPEAMLKAVARQARTPGQFSLEERMGCGFGACMGCTIETRSGLRRVCCDGPVFASEELLWT